MKKPKGYLKVAEIRGVSIFAHWSFPLGGAFFAWTGHADPTQWVCYIFAFTCLVIIHELGHAIAARLVGLKVHAIEFFGFGGICRLEPPRRTSHGFLVYSGGLIAQFVLLLVTMLYLGYRGEPRFESEKAIVNTFTFVNIIVFFTNLIPFKSVGHLRSGTDGYVLWKLLLRVFKTRPHPLPVRAAISPDKAPVFPPETRLLSMKEFRPRNFLQGIEILNDRTTPMDFVVHVLGRHLKLSHKDATLKMLEIHSTGGILIPLPSIKEAKDIAEAITVEARAAGFPLVCRYADIEIEDGAE